MAKTIAQWANEIANAKEAMDTERAELANIYKRAEDEDGVNRPALKLAVKLKGWKSDKRNDFLRSFDDYREELQLDEQPELFDGTAESRQAAE